MTTAAVRKAFYSLVCFVSLGMSAMGAYTTLSAILRTTVFSEADRYYPTVRPSGDNVRDEEADKKNAIATRQKDFSWSMPMLAISAPIFLLFYPNVKSDT